MLHATYLAQWLENFASGEFQNKSQLYRYLIDNNVQTRRWRKIWAKLWVTAVDKILDSQRLLVYAWYTTYPKEWITDLIAARHEPIISLDIAKQILARLKWTSRKELKTRKDYSDQLPLRWLVYCKECWWVMTWWRSRGSKGKYYWYYNCWKPWCCQKSKTIKASLMHEDVRKLMVWRKPDEWVNNLFDVIFDELLQDNLKTHGNSQRKLEKRIQNIDEDVEIVTSKVLTLDSEILLKKLEQQLKKLQQEKEQIQIELEAKHDEKLDTELYNYAKSLFNNLNRLWDIKDYELRTLLIGVRSNWKIYYKKGLGASNSETSICTLLFSIFWTNLLQWGVVTRNPVGITRR